MTELEIFEVTRDIVSHVLSEDKENITEKTVVDLKNRRPFGIDNLDAVELVITLEKEFNISLIVKELYSCENIEQIVALISRKLNFKKQIFKK